jgi:hypothetical protein
LRTSSVFSLIGSIPADGRDVLVRRRPLEFGGLMSRI